MRLLLLTWACDREDISEPGVSARWAAELAQDHEITLFSVSKPERFGCVRDQFPQLDVIEWQDIRVPSALTRLRAVAKPGYVSYYGRARRFLRELLSRQRFEVIHHLTPFAWRYPSPAAGLGVPLVRGPVAGGLAPPQGLGVSADNLWHPGQLLRSSDAWRARNDPLLRASYRDTHHLLMAAPYVADLMRALPIGASSVENEHGLDAAPPLPSRFAARATLQLLFVGRLVAFKGARLAIEAMARSSLRQRLRLTVVGDGPERADCIEAARCAGLASQVRFAGWCDSRQVAEHYRAADIFLFPSYREPSGGVLLEAMAHGLPVISCAYGGPDHLVTEACGIKVAPAPEAAFVANLARAIDRLGGDDSLRQAAARAALQRAGEFDWGAKRARMAELYRRVALGVSDADTEAPRFDTVVPASQAEVADGRHHHSRA